MPWSEWEILTELMAMADNETPTTGAAATEGHATPAERLLRRAG